MKHILKYMLATFLLISIQGSSYAETHAWTGIRAKTVYKSEAAQRIRSVLSIAAAITAVPALYAFIILMLSDNRPHEYSVAYPLCKNLHSLNFPGIHLLEDGGVEFTARTLKTFLGYGLGTLLAGALVSPTTDYVDSAETTLTIDSFDSNE